MRSRNSLRCERLANLRKKADAGPLSTKEMLMLRSENGKCLWDIYLMIHMHLPAEESILWHRSTTNEGV